MAVVHTGLVKDTTDRLSAKPDQLSKLNFPAKAPKNIRFFDSNADEALVRRALSRYSVNGAVIELSPKFTLLLKALNHAAARSVVDEDWKFTGSPVEIIEAIKRDLLLASPLFSRLKPLRQLQTLELFHDLLVWYRKCDPNPTRKPNYELHLVLRLTTSHGMIHQDYLSDKVKKFRLVSALVGPGTSWYPDSNIQKIMSEYLGKKLPRKLALRALIYGSFAMQGEFAESPDNGIQIVPERSMLILEGGAFGLVHSATKCSRPRLLLRIDRVN